MARLDDLTAELKDPILRRKLQDAIADLKRRQRFGLVFEEHIPETTTLPGLSIQPGSILQRRDANNGSMLYRALAVNGRKITIEPLEGGSSTTAPTKDLLVVKRFGDPVFPALTPLGSLRRGAQDKPHHAVINGENFHALQLLVYLHEGQLDCIYIDPPYNTGARDWKYNNRFVDNNDSWRHSKWLSMMEKRLRLAKRLLKPDGVLICTIDEHEVHHLGMLLETIFRDAYRQMVSIVINPKGVTQGRFSRVNEFAFFCFYGNSNVVGRGDDLLSPEADSDLDDIETGEPQKPRWKGLLRSGTNARRQDRRNMFYPILIDSKREAVVGTGEPLPFKEKPDFDAKIKGFAVAWPVRSDRSLGNWGVGHTTLRRLIEKGYVALGDYDSKRKTWAISYLSKQSQEQIASGVLEVVAFHKERNVVDVQYTGIAARRIKTVWHRSRHDAGVGGTDVLRALLGSRAFSFPKSVYAVYDCLAPILRDRKDALILDFFAGSGTTLHATAMLNASDEGRRRCILITNNEVEGEAANELNRRGLFPGDAEYEAHGVFELVTRPRCEAVISGHRPDKTPIPGSHLDGRPYSQGFPENVEFFRLGYLDPDEIDLGTQFDAILPSLWLAAGGIGVRDRGASGKAFTIPPVSRFGVLFRDAGLRKFKEELRIRPDVTHAWLVTDSEEAFAEMESALPSHLTVSMLYRDYLRNFRINTRDTL